MREETEVSPPRQRILIVAPQAPPVGGMAVQAQILTTLLRNDGTPVLFFASNFAFPSWLRPIERVPGARTLLRFALIWPMLLKSARQVDVLHVFAASWLYFFAVVFPAAAVGRLCGKRVILNYRGGDARPFFARYGWAARRVFSLADSVTTPSRFLASMIESRFRISVRIVPNIIDTSAFSFRERTTFQPRMLVTRQLEKIYDVESVLKAFRKVQASWPGASLWIAGSGSEEARLRSLAGEWGLEGVRFLGRVAHRDLPALYNQCDLFLNGSHVDNFPGALLEASAAGLVVISTGAGGIPFMYEHGKTALLVEPGDWAGLAAAAEDALRRPAAALELTKNATALVRSCEWGEVRRALYAVYGDLDGAGAKPSSVCAEAH